MGQNYQNILVRYESLGGLKFLSHGSLGSAIVLPVIHTSSYDSN